MAYEFDNKAPIFIQLKQLFRRSIVAGELKPGEQMSPVREIAITYGVNPNTVQRALSELEREGLMYTRRTSGRFVTENLAQIALVRQELVSDLVRNFAQDIAYLGYQLKDVQSLLQKEWRNEDDNI